MADPRRASLSRVSKIPDVKISQQKHMLNCSWPDPRHPVVQIPPLSSREVGEPTNPTAKTEHGRVPVLQGQNTARGEETRGIAGWLLKYPKGHTETLPLCRGTYILDLGF